MIDVAAAWPSICGLCGVCGAPWVIALALFVLVRRRRRAIARIRLAQSRVQET